MKVPILALLLVAGCATAPPAPPAQVPRSAPDDIGAKTSSMQKIDGYIPLYWDEANGKLLMEISRFGEEMLYHTSLPAGVGSNPIGLDRNQIGSQHIVRFRRLGPRGVIVEANPCFPCPSHGDAREPAV